MFSSGESAPSVRRIGWAMATVDRGLWTRIIQQVVADGGNIIRPWFTQLEPISLDYGLLEIQTPGRKEQKYCQRNATRLFTEAAQAATGRLVGVCFLTEAQQSTQPDASAAAGAALVEDDDTALRFNEDYSFGTFVMGPCNRLAHAACTAVSEAPGRSYNPLFLHGSVGLGKTHLLQAACRRISAASERPNVCMLSCETFVNHFIEAVGRGALHEFRYRYRHADVLAIDDIQFLSDHEQTQEEFFHTFNTLYQSQKQIILSSDRSPSEISGLEERLVSRFNWGLVAQIDRPCYETRMAIVKRKAELRSVDLSQDVVCFIAGTIDSNTRELEGAISKVAMLARVTDRPIDVEVAREALGAARDAQRREITIESILSVVAPRYNVRLADLQSKKRNRSIVFPRQICMYLARTLTRHSLEEIGGYFGGRDHTTVMHANRSIAGKLAEDVTFQATIERLTREIQAKA